MPIGMLGSLVICTMLYVLMSSVLTGMVPFKELNDAAPVVAALETHPQLHWLQIWVKVGALAGMTSVMLVMIIAQARIFLTMSRDGLLPKFFGSVHPRFRTPHTATVDHRRAWRRHRRPAAGRHPRRAGVDRHAGRLHRGVHRRAGAAPHAPGPARDRSESRPSG